MTQTPAPIQQPPVDENTNKFHQVWTRWFQDISETIQNLAAGGALTVNNISPDGAGNVEVNAIDIDYNNATSGLLATNVQNAINEVLTVSRVSRGLEEEYETVSKNLKSYSYALNYTSGDLISIDYTVPSIGTITKTLNYTSGQLTSVILSGATPISINLTKTLTYTGSSLTNVTYS